MSGSAVRPRGRDLRLVPVAAAAWAAAGAAITFPDAAAWLAVALWGTAAVVLGVATRIARRRHACALAAVALALAAATASHAALAEPARAAASALAVDGGRALDVTATVTGKVERTASGQLRFDAQATRIDIGADEHGASVPVVVQVAPADVDGGVLDVGSVVIATGTAFRADAGDRAVLVVRASRGLRVLAGPSGAAAVTANLRQGLVGAVRGLPEPGAGLVPGLAVGDTSAVSTALDADMKQSSLSHLTAVSGANCAIVVGLAFAGAALFGARRGIRVGAALTTLVGFVLLVTPEPSVVRAAAMAAIAMLGVLLGRTGAGVSLLSLATAVVLIGDPWLAASLGFALSVVATAALLVLARPLGVGLARWMPRSLALALAIPLAAQLVCGPLLIIVNPTVPLYGVIANLLAAPAAPIATIAGLAACLAAPVPALQSGLAAIAWLPASWIAATARTTVALPGSAIPWLGGWLGILALAVVGAAVVVLITVSRSRRLAARTAHHASLLILAGATGIVAGVGALGGVAGPLTVPSAWAVAACDIGQGDAVVLRSESRVALIDTGPDPARLDACLSKLGIARVDLLVLTHFDLDHVGGTSAVFGRADVVLHGPAAEEPHRVLIEKLAAGGAQIVDARQGLSGTLGTARWEVLWPRGESRAFPSGNPASVVLDVRGPDVPASLFLGDMDAPAQRALLASGALNPPYAIVKVAHHGSADQAPELYRSLRAAVALVSVGVDNTYGHPRAETLTMLTAFGIAIARTDQEGLIAVSVGSVGLSVWHERAPPGVGAGG